jgi:hypothetical protein
MFSPGQLSTTELHSYPYPRLFKEIFIMLIPQHIKKIEQKAGQTPI